MSRHMLLLVLLLISLLAPVSASAQLVPPAGTAGAGLTPINGIPFGPNNPSSISDPSGQLNASKLAPLRANPPNPAPPPQPVYRALPSPERASVPYASQRLYSANEVETARPSGRRHSRTYVSHFKGICTGC